MQFPCAGCPCVTEPQRKKVHIPGKATDLVITADKLRVPVWRFDLKGLPLILILLTCASLQAQVVHVSKIKFRGNKKISAGKLEDAIHTKADPWYTFPLFWKSGPVFDEEVFLADLLRLEKFYHQEGYLEARVLNYELKYNDRKDKVRITVYLDEGEATKVDQVTFVYADTTSPPIPPRKLLGMVKLKSGKRYREEDLKLDYNRLVQRFSDNGYPYIQVRVKPILDRKAHKVDLEWRLRTGPASYFGEIKITGNRSVSQNVIRRGLGFRTGQPFKQKKLTTAQRQVYRLELFQFVSLRATDLDRRPTHIPIEVRVKEATLRTLKLGAGFGSEEAFRSSLEWRHRNFLGGARILRANAKHSSNILPLQLNLELSQPYFLSNRNDLIAKPFFVWEDERSFEVRSYGLETTLNRQISGNTDTFISTRFERNDVNAKVDTVAAVLKDRYNNSVTRVGIRRNSTDQLFTPSRGIVSTFVIEEGGRFLSTPFKYIKAFTEHRFFVPVKPGYVFATRFLIGAMNPIRGSRETPVEERFFAGGSYSVRGWERQLLGPVDLNVAPDGRVTPVPRGGNSILEGSFELRYPVFKRFSGAVFLDYGNVWEAWNGIDFTDLHYALGAGLRYNTVIGPLRVDFAWKLNKQRYDTRNYQIHFSIGQAF